MTRPLNSSQPLLDNINNAARIGEGMFQNSNESVQAQQQFMLPMDTSTDISSTEDRANGGSTTNDDVTENDYFLQQYYTYFHVAHPVLLPKEKLVHEEFDAKFLVDTARFIGSHFTNSRSEISQSSILSALDSAPNDSVFKVQGLLLMSVALHLIDDQVGCQQNLDKAIDIALDLGLYSRNSAIMKRCTDRIMQESIRRTWWELYVVDAMTATFFQKISFRTQFIPADIELPCDEAFYSLSSEMQPLRTVDELDGRFFADTDIVFSSYSYRIESIRLLSRAMTTSYSLGGQRDEVDAIDAALSSWLHHLPPEKREILDPTGRCDEMLFQAHLMIHSATIHLHLPRSTLSLAKPSNSGVECARRCHFAPPASTYHTHAVKAVNAAAELARLASLPTSLFKHTPFFICGLVISSVVQLSACAINACSCLHPHRDQIVQSIGMLKTLSQAWDLAKFAMTQVRNVAREVEQLGVRSFAMDTTQPKTDSRIIEDASWAPEIATMLEPSTANLNDFIANNSAACGWDVLALRS